MGVYLVNVGGDEWHEDDSLRAISDELNEILAGTGMPPYNGPDSGTDISFEQKFHYEDTRFNQLVTTLVGPASARDILYWDMIVPLDFDGCLTFNEPSAYSSTTTIASAIREESVMSVLARQLRLPSTIPDGAQPYAINQWFDEAERIASPDPWCADLHTSFHVATRWRAATFAIRWNCPMRWI